MSAASPSAAAAVHAYADGVLKAYRAALAEAKKDADGWFSDEDDARTLRHLQEMGPGVEAWAVKAAGWALRGHKDTGSTYTVAEWEKQGAYYVSALEYYEASNSVLALLPSPSEVLRTAGGAIAGAVVAVAEAQTALPVAVAAGLKKKVTQATDAAARQMGLPGAGAPPGKNPTSPWAVAAGAGFALLTVSVAVGYAVRSFR